MQYNTIFKETLDNGGVTEIIEVDGQEYKVFHYNNTTSISKGCWMGQGDNKYWEVHNWTWRMAFDEIISVKNCAYIAFHTVQQYQQGMDAGREDMKDSFRKLLGARPG